MRGTTVIAVLIIMFGGMTIDQVMRQHYEYKMKALEIPEKQCFHEHWDEIGHGTKGQWETKTWSVLRTAIKCND